MLKKVVILAGGFGTRLQEETIVTPKPLVHIGDKPILWHIMNIFSHYGYKEFIICLGYKGYLIKEYFANYLLYNSDVTIDLSNNNKKVTIHEHKSEPWKVTLLDTGLHTQTGGRIQRIKRYVEGEPFFLTYGDGVANVDIKALVNFHFSHSKIATVTGVKSPSKFGVIDVDENSQARKFGEKPRDTASWINGGFFILNPEVFKYLIYGDDMSWESTPLENLVANNELMVYKHEGFWQCMDTLRDLRILTNLWESGQAPWKVWE
ncbi:MAG: glucose-1-phosphate cytidylyltransferase [Candidatus Hodarchaeota archaeon]